MVARPMSQALVQSERETPRGWQYRVRVERDGRATDHEVTLAWVDHEHWSGGRHPPSTVVERLFAVLLERRLDLPERFDATTARRWFRELDAELIRRL